MAKPQVGFAIFFDTPRVSFEPGNYIKKYFEFNSFYAEMDGTLPVTQLVWHF